MEPHSRRVHVTTFVDSEGNLATFHEQVTSSVQQHWEKVFQAKPIDRHLMDRVVACHSKPFPAFETALDFDQFVTLCSACVTALRALMGCPILRGRALETRFNGIFLRCTDSG